MLHALNRRHVAPAGSGGLASLLQMFRCEADLIICSGRGLTGTTCQRKFKALGSADFDPFSGFQTEMRNPAPDYHSTWAGELFNEIYLSDARLTQEEGVGKSRA